MTDPQAGAGARFMTTRWSVVLSAAAAGVLDSSDALARLCETYRPPVYAYIRRRGIPPEDADDFTQEFFATFLQKNFVRAADPARGRFRSFLLASVKHFLANEWDRRHAQKRGGRAPMLPLEDDRGDHTVRYEPSTAMTPDRVFEYQWAQAVLDRALDDLRTEQEQAGKGDAFRCLRPCLMAESGRAHADAVVALNSTAGAVRVALHRLRRRFRAILLERIGETVAEPAEIDAELRYLMNALESPDAAVPGIHV
jgi:RNA polymerase sigma factor (sigma-70 family)